MKKVLNFLILLLLVMPCMVFAEKYDYNEGVTRANNYINSFNDRYKYLNFNKPYRFDGGKICYDGNASCLDTSNPGSSVFLNGGFLNKDEYLTTLSGGNSYLSGSEYWTMTFNKNAANKVHTISNILKSDRNLNDSLGVRVTEFVKPGTKVTGTGRPNDPWMFYPQYRVSITSGNKDMGKIKDANGVSRESVEFFLKKGVTQSFELDITLGYRYVSNTCGLEYRNRKLYVNQISKDYGCIVEFDRALYEFSLYDETATTQAVPQKIYHILEENWYKDDTMTNKFTALTTAPTKTGYNFKGYYYGNPKNGGTLVINSDKTLVPGVKIDPNAMNLDNINQKLTIDWEARVINCAAGRYLPKNSVTCAICKAGSYCPGGNLTFSETADQGITACPANYRDGGTGAKAENECVISIPAGYELPTAKGNKSQCKAGTYRSGATTKKYGETLACAKCVAGKYSTTVGATAATTCQNCPAGTFSTVQGATSSATCKKCVEGSYQNAAGKTACIKCANGKTSDAGSSSCDKNCSNNTGVNVWVTPTWNSDNTMTNLCTINKCNAGYYKDGNKCTACAKGSTSTVGSTTCTACQASGAAGSGGTTGGAGGTSCNTSCGKAGVNAWETATWKTGNTVEKSCTIKSCAKGYYKNGNSCVACAANAYQDATGQTSCKACAKGKTSSVGRTSACTDNCSNRTGVGEWETPSWNSSNNTVSNACTVKSCAAGYYKNGNACTKCPTGYTSNAGATSSTQCNIKRTYTINFKCWDNSNWGSVSGNTAKIGEYYKLPTSKCYEHDNWEQNGWCAWGYSTSGTCTAKGPNGEAASHWTVSNTNNINNNRGWVWDEKWAAYAERYGDKLTFYANWKENKPAPSGGDDGGQQCCWLVSGWEGCQGGCWNNGAGWEGSDFWCCCC